MKSNKKTGLLLLGGATILYLAKSSGASGGLILVPTGSFGSNEVVSPSSGLSTPTSLPNVIINESSLPNYNPPTADTKKTISSNSFSQSIPISSSSLSGGGVGNVQDYNALPDDSPTKKAFKSQYPSFPVTDSKGKATGMTMTPTYGLGAGGTATYSYKAPTTKKESSKKKSWWKFW